MRLTTALLIAIAAGAALPSCLGPEARCEAGNATPRCPVSGESPLTTRYEPVCGEARVDCSGPLRVIAPDGRPTCDPTAPEDGPICAGGWTPYCYFADCRDEP